MGKGIENQESKEQEEIKQILTNAIIEMPITFNTDSGRFYCLYQPSLGIYMLCEPILRSLEIDETFMQFNSNLEMLRIVSSRRLDILRLVAYHSFKRRSDAIDEEMVSKRIKEFSDVIKDDDLVTIFSYVLSWNSWQSKLTKHFKLDIERDTRQKVQDASKKDGGMTFGGRSIYGSLIDFACSRYGWQLGYVVWGISLTNLNMMMADSVTSVYLSKEKMREIGVSNDREILSGDDKSSFARLRELAKTT